MVRTSGKQETQTQLEGVIGVTETEATIADPIWIVLSFLHMCLVFLWDY